MIGIPDDLSGVARAAGPMSRAELTRASQNRLGTIAADGAAGNTGSIPSTFRQGLGEVMDDLPRKSGRKLLVIGLAAIAAVAVVTVIIKGKQDAAAEARRSAATAASVAGRLPTKVRVNFNSDPAQASVVRADTGQELGLTPLSVELPYGDAALEFVFKKPGFENKVVSIVPNLPSPLFTTLQPVAVKPEVKPALPVEPAMAADLAPKKPAPKKKPRVQKLDDDAVLEPSFK
jgi:hypothetical protein